MALTPVESVVSGRIEGLKLTGGILGGATEGVNVNGCTIGGNVSGEVKWEDVRSRKRR